MTIFTDWHHDHTRMRDKHVDDVSLQTYIHTYIGTANLPYVTLAFGARSGSPRISTHTSVPAWVSAEGRVGWPLYAPTATLHHLWRSKWQQKRYKLSALWATQSIRLITFNIPIILIAVSYTRLSTCRWKIAARKVHYVISQDIVHAAQVWVAIGDNNKNSIITS